MIEQAKVCIKCGIQEVETSAICPACADGAQGEALGHQTTLRHQAE